MLYQFILNLDIKIIKITFVCLSLKAVIAVGHIHIAAAFNIAL